MLKMFLDLILFNKGFLCLYKLIAVYRLLLSYTLDYIAFSVVVKNCKPLIKPFICSL